MFHPIPFKRLFSISLGNFIVYLYLTLVFVHFQNLENQRQQMEDITNPNSQNQTRTMTLIEFKKSARACYSTNRTSGDRNVNDNYKVLINSNIEKSTFISFMWFLPLILAMFAGCLLWGPPRWEAKEMKSRLTTFKRKILLLENFFLWAYLVVLSANVSYSISAFYWLNTEIMLGHFYDLGIRFLLDAHYLSSLFPNRLYCYLRNEKGEELYSESIILRNQVTGPVTRLFFLAIWFTLAFSLLLKVTLFAQVIALTYSKTCRFRRLKKLLPSANEELLGQLSRENSGFSMRLEILETVLSRSKFRELLDNLKTSMSTQENKDALALVLVKSSS